MLLFKAVTIVISTASFNQKQWIWNHIAFLLNRIMWVLVSIKQHLRCIIIKVTISRRNQRKFLLFRVFPLFSQQCPSTNNSSSFLKFGLEILFSRCIEQRNSFSSRISTKSTQFCLINIQNLKSSLWDFIGNRNDVNSVVRIDGCRIVDIRIIRFNLFYY